MALLEIPVQSTTGLLLSGSFALVLYFIIISIYRIFFHPLAKYPGPIQYKLTGWPLVWQAYKGNRHIWHFKDHETYGPIVRIAPNTLSFNTASALTAIYGPRNANVEKGEWYKTFDVAAGSYSSVTETDKEKHAARRRWMSPAFTVELQRANEPAIIEVIERLCDTLDPAGDDWGKNWNITNVATHLGFDLMSRVVFGCDIRSVQEEKHRGLADSILPAMQFLYWVSYLPMTILVRPLLRTRLFEIVGGQAVTDNNRLIEFASSQVQTQSCNIRDTEKDLSTDHNSLLSRLVNTQDKRTGWQPTRADLDTESLNLINAGVDPYSGALAALIFYLVNNTEALEKATIEVRSTFATPDEICSGMKLNSCTYVYGCIEETLRRAAPVPSHMPRVIQSGGMNIDGHHLPAGTVVGVSTYAIHHNPTHFGNPWAFQPERWIESSTISSEDIKHARKAFSPFSLGTRGCPGQNLAYLQLKLTLAHMLYHYDIRDAPNDPVRGGGGPGLEEGRHREDEFQLKDAFGFGRDGPVVQFKRVQ